MIRALALLALVWAGAAQGACRQALVLALDVSGSVDAREYRLQLDGVAAALESVAVQEVLFATGAAPVRLAVFEWSGPEDQAMILDWTGITDPAALARVTARLRAHQRQPKAPTTALGSAMQTGLRLLAAQPACWTHTLDISGDGEANTGPRPQDVTLTGAPPGTLVNGLVIGAPDGALARYFTAYVIRGAGAFVEEAAGFEDYAAAMERKLIRELAALAIGAR